MFADPQTGITIASLANDALLRNIVVFIFMGLLVSAAIVDLRRFIIPDTIVVALLALWPIWVALNGLGPIGYALLGGVGMFVLGLTLFAFGLMGGGDVKLMTVLALWAEPSGLLTFLFYTSLAGGFLSIYWLLPLRRLVAPMIGWAEGQRNNKQIPYGVAISAGGLAIAQRLWVG